MGTQHVDAKLHPLARAAWRCYEWSPDLIVDAMVRCLPYIAFCLDLRVPLARLSGPVQPDGQLATILVAGAEPWRNYLPGCFFTGPPRQESLGVVPLLALPRTLRNLRESADLTIARIDRLAARLLFGAEYLAVPEWVTIRRPLPDDPAVLSRASHSLGQDLRLAYRHGLVSELSHTDADFETFFHTMYVPFAQRRYGEQAIVRNFYQLRRRFRQGGLIWMQYNGDRIAGLLFQRCGSVCHYLVIGTAGGEWAPVKLGAISALYYQAMLHARALGCRTIDFGGCRPSLTDGVLRYKRKWGVQVVDKHNSFFDFLVHWRRMEGSAFALLRRTPLIFRDHGKLSAIAAVENEAPGEQNHTQQLVDTLWLDGLHRIYLVSRTECSPRIGDLPHVSLINLVATGDGGPQALLAVRETGDSADRLSGGRRSIPGTSGGEHVLYRRPE